MKKIIAAQFLMFVLAPLAAFAAGVESIIDPKSDKYQTGNYEVNDFLALGATVTQYILGIVGSVALLAFVVGGVRMIMSRGDKGEVKKGKDAVFAAVIGMVIVFTSYILVQFLMKQLLGVQTQ
jgi:hypothetical protein